MSEKGIRAWIAAGAAAAGVIGANWWNVSNRIDAMGRDLRETIERRHDEAARERRDDVADLKDAVAAVGRRVDESNSRINGLAEDVGSLAGEVGYIRGTLDATGNQETEQPGG